MIKGRKKGKKNEKKRGKTKKTKKGENKSDKRGRGKRNYIKPPYDSRLVLLTVNFLLPPLLGNTSKHTGSQTLMKKLLL